MPSQNRHHSARPNRNLLRVVCALALLASITVVVLPSGGGHPPERIALTGRAVPINPTALPVELAPTTVSTTSTTVTSTTVPIRRPAKRLPPAPTPAGGALEAIAAHFSDLYDQAVHVATCESTLNPSAIGGPNYGLFQINRVHADDFETVTGVPFAEGWSNADLNARYARHLYDQLGWGPWACRPR